MMRVFVALGVASVLSVGVTAAPAATSPIVLEGPSWKAIELGGRLAKFLASAIELALGNRQQPIHGEAAKPFLESKLLFELVAAEAERRPSLQRLLGLEIVHVPANRV